MKTSEDRNEYLKNYMRWKRQRERDQAKPLPALVINEPEDFPPHKCIQTVNGKTVYVEDPNYSKMCQYVHCRKPSTATTEVFRQHLRVCAYHKELVEWVDPNKPKLKPEDSEESEFRDVLDAMGESKL